HVVVAWILLTTDRLNPRRPIDMANRWNPRRFFLASVEHEEHERRDVAIDEPFACTLLENDRRDGAKILAVLDVVEARLHPMIERRRENRASAQCARTELHPALEPADDLVLHQEIGGAFRHIVEPAIRYARPTQESFDLRVT